MAKLNSFTKMLGCARRRLPQWLAVVVVAALPVSILIIQACSKDDKGTGPDEDKTNIAKGFRAEVYIAGQLATNKFITGKAEMSDPLEYAYIDVESASEGYRIHLSFWNKLLNGIQGMTPGKFDSTKYGEPYFVFEGPGLSKEIRAYIYSGQIVDALCFPPPCTIHGTASGEILEVNQQRVVGKFQAKGNNNAWEIRNCEFNVDF
jgi:hypothetical protein